MKYTALLSSMPLAACGKEEGPARSAAVAAGKALFTANACNTCHGDTGHGDGLAAANLDPKPRSYADKAWQKSKTDDQIKKVIKGRWSGHRLSPLMAAYGQLSDADLNNLVAYIRSFGSSPKSLLTQNPGPGANASGPGFDSLDLFLAPIAPTAPLLFLAALVSACATPRPENPESELPSLEPAPVPVAKVPAGDQARGKMLWIANACNACHGDAGRGRACGHGNRYPIQELRRTLRLAATVDDARLMAEIRQGSAAFGGSPLMPAYAQFTDQELLDLVAVIRSFAK
ncbi:MAG: cytochrome c [Planctomycetota bacterium]